MFLSLFSVFSGTKRSQQMVAITKSGLALFNSVGDGGRSPPVFQFNFIHTGY